MSQYSLNSTLLAATLFSCSLFSYQSHAQLQCQDVQIELDAQGMASLTPEVLLAEVNMAEGVSLSVDQDSFDCADNGQHAVTLTMTDENNEQTTCTSLVTVVDKLAPEVEVENMTVYLSEMGTASPDLSTCITSLSDNCSSNFSYRFSHEGFTTNHLGFNEAKIGVSDESGNQVTKLFVVQVLPPVVDTEGGLPDLDLEMFQESFEFYPNPATSVVTIDASGSPLGMITILNSTGKEVLQIESEELKTQIDIDELPVGMYFIECNSKVKRFIKK